MNTPARIETEADDPYIRAVVAETIREAEESPTGRPPIATRTLQLDTGQLFEVPVDLAVVAAEAIDILKGRYKARLGEAFKDKPPRRILDVGAGVGAFAVWASTVWPHAWIDCVEDDDELAEVCRKNIPLGAMLSRDMADEEQGFFSCLARYDLVRVASQDYDGLDDSELQEAPWILFDCLSARR